MELDGGDPNKPDIQICSEVLSEKKIKMQNCMCSMIIIKVTIY